MLEIALLWFESCPNHRAARRLLHEALAETGIEANIQDIRIDEHEQAVCLRFQGSPTIRVDGRDVQPTPEEETPYGMACRIYRTPDGPQGFPTKALIRAALARATGAAAHRPDRSQALTGD